MVAGQKNGVQKATRYAWFICGLTAVFYCYEYLLRIQPGAMSSELMRYYSLNAAGFGNLFATYYYIYTFMQIPVGLLLDRYGPRILLSLAALMCAAGAFLFACSQLLWIALLGRFMMGLGSAFAFVGVLKVASTWLPNNRFAMIAALTTVFGMVGGLFGVNLIAFIVKSVGWRATVYGSAVCGLFLAGLLWHYIRNPNFAPESASVELEGPHTFQDLIKQVLLTLKKRELWLIAGIGGILYTSLSVFAELWGIPYLEHAKHLSTQQASLFVSTVFLGWAIGGPLLGLFADHFNNQRTPLMIGSIVGAMTISVVIYIDSLPRVLMAVLLFLFGAAASSQSIVFAIAKDSVGPRLAASAIAVTNMFVMAVGTMLQPLVGKILDWSWDGTVIEGVHRYSNENFQMALVIIPVAFMLSAGLAWCLQKTYNT